MYLKESYKNERHTYAPRSQRLCVLESKKMHNVELESSIYSISKPIIWSVDETRATFGDCEFARVQLLEPWGF